MIEKLGNWPRIRGLVLLLMGGFFASSTLAQMPPLRTGAAWEQVEASALDLDTAVRSFLARVSQQQVSSGLSSMSPTGSVIVVEQYGDSNVAEVSQIGPAHQAYILHDGSFNETFLKQRGSGNSFTLKFYGDGNELTFEQDGVGNSYTLEHNSSTEGYAYQTPGGLPRVQRGYDNHIIEIGMGGVPMSIEQRGNGIQMKIDHRSGN